MRSLLSEIAIRLLKVSDLLLITIPFVLAWHLYYAERTASPFHYWGNWVVIGLFVFLYFIFGRTYDAFLISHNRVSEIMISQSLSAFLADAVIYVVIMLLAKHLINPVPLILALLVQMVLGVLWVFLASFIYYHLFPAKKTVIIYDKRKGMGDVIREYKMQRKFNVIKTLHAKECLDDMSVLEEAEAVFLSGVPSHDRNIILKYCINKDIRVYMIPRIGDVILSGAQQVHLFHLPVLRVGRYKPTPEYIISKRLFDIISSLLGLIILSPLFLAVAIAIKVSDKGPVIYKQERLTKDGKRFMIHKFRSMVVDAEKDGIARLSTGPNDDRITPVGRFIRKFRIDELPQLIDILAGNLSVVGPRPERPEIAEEYMKVMPEFQLRLQCKAGLTGYAQVYGKYNATPYDKLQMDLMYIANPSFAEDIRICLATIRLLFTPESTEGVAQGRITALEYEEQDNDN